MTPQDASVKAEEICRLAPIVPVLVVTPIGARIGDRLKSKTFSRLVLALLGFSGLVLLVAAF